MLASAVPTPDLRPVGLELMGHPHWASEEIFADRLARGENLDALKLLMTDWLASWKVQDLYRAAQAGN